MDANGNGTLEPNEVPEERRGMFRFLAGRMGFDPEKPVAIDQVRQTVMRQSENREEGAGPGESGQASPNKPAEKPLVPGFGVQQALARVPAFGERVEAGTSSGGSSGGASNSDERNSRMSRFAGFVLRRYDRNRNGTLEKEEWGDMREDPSPADRNHDGVLTLEELTAGLAERMGGRSDESGGGSSRSSDESSGSGAAGSNGRKSYRFLTSAERLPEGLPDWFARQDANADGQVAMAEYAAYWSDSTAREFDRYDLNHDGVITPSECLNAGRGAGQLAGTAGGPPGAPPSAPAGGPPGAPPSGPPGAPGGGPPAPSSDQGESKPWWLQ